MIAKEVEESIAWANLKSKSIYDAHHRAISFAKGDEVYLTLHKGYALPGVDKAKFQDTGRRTFTRRHGPSVLYNLSANRLTVFESCTSQCRIRRES